MSTSFVEGVLGFSTDKKMQSIMSRPQPKLNGHNITKSSSESRSTFAIGAAACSQTLHGNFHVLVPYRLLNNATSLVPRHRKFDDEEFGCDSPARDDERCGAGGQDVASECSELESASNADSDHTYQCSNAGDLSYSGRINPREALKVAQDSTVPVRKSMNIPPPGCQIEVNGIPRKGWKMKTNPKTGRPARDYLLNAQEPDNTNMGPLGDVAEILTREPYRSRNTDGPNSENLGGDRIQDAIADHGEARAIRSNAARQRFSEEPPHADPRVVDRVMLDLRRPSTFTSTEERVAPIATSSAAGTDILPTVKNHDIPESAHQFKQKKNKRKSRDEKHAFIVKRPKHGHNRSTTAVSLTTDAVAYNNDDTTQELSVEASQDATAEVFMPPETHKGEASQQVETMWLSDARGRPRSDNTFVDDGNYPPLLRSFRGKVKEELRAAGMPSSEALCLASRYMQQAWERLQQQNAQLDAQKAVDAVYATYQAHKQDILRGYYHEKTNSQIAAIGANEVHDSSITEAFEVTLGTTVTHTATTGESTSDSVNESHQTSSSSTSGHQSNGGQTFASTQALAKSTHDKRWFDKTSLPHEEPPRSRNSVIQSQGSSTYTDHPNAPKTTSVLENNGLRSLLTVLGFSSTTIDHAANGNMTLSARGTIQVHVTGVRAALAL